MATLSTERPRTGWLGWFRDQGYLFRQAAILTIAMGAYAHLTRAFIGDELLLEHVVTVTFDRILLIPMAYAAVTGLLSARRIAFRGRGQRIAFWVAWAYMAISVPLHVVISYVLVDTELVTRFPLWYSYLLLPVYAAMIWLFARLRYRS